MLKKDLDKALDIVNELETTITELLSSSNAPPGLRLRIYQLLVDLRETIIKARRSLTEHQ